MKMIHHDNNLLQTEEEEYFDLKTFSIKFWPVGGGLLLVYHYVL